MDSTKIVGEKIKSLRETKEISVAELAVRSGLAEEQIERIENNVDLPSLAPLIKIARALGVRLGTFLDDQEEQGAVIIRKTKCFDFWERNVLFPKTKRSFFRTPTLPFSA